LGDDNRFNRLDLVVSFYLDLGILNLLSLFQILSFMH
jgi:hypothetical protein